MLDQSTDCVKILSPEGRVEYINQNGRCTMEIDDFAAVSGQSWPDFWPAESRGPIEDAIRAAREGRGSRFEAFCPTIKGTPKWWDVSVSPIDDRSDFQNPAGGHGVFAIVAISRDITERRQHAESVQTISQEMRHRLRNAYAIAGAITLASAREAPASQPFAADLAQRFTALSIAQSHLIDGSGGDTLEALLALLADAFDPGLGLIGLHH
ncbi:MAG: PAS domain-containing protein, partial [Betaproteobacteria bacterium]